MTSEQWRKGGAACIFCNGELKNPARAKQLAGGCNLLVAADGGVNHLVRLNLTAQVIVGDMDSMVAEPWSGSEKPIQISHSPNKDKSDTQLAVEYVFQQGFQQVTLIAAVGGRLDHSLGNVALVAQYPGRVAMIDEHYTLVAADKSQKCRLQGRIGALVSLIPYGTDPTRVRTTGLKYPLEDKVLAHATHGLSNEMVEPKACVWVSEGTILVYIESEEVWSLR